MTILAALPENSKVPDILLFYTQIAAYYHDKLTFEQISPRLAVKHTTTPILYLHGQKDTLIPPQMSQDLYNSTAGAKEIHFFANTPHASAVYSDKKSYAEIIQSFIEKSTRK